MNNLLKKLVDIDKEAQAIDEELRKEKENLQNEIQKEIEKTREQCMRQAQTTIDKETQIIQCDAESKWKKENRKHKKSQEELENKFNENSEKWIESIVADVLA